MRAGCGHAGARDDAPEQWGYDLVSTWSLTREIRKVEKSMAFYQKPPAVAEPLPRDPQSLQVILRQREEALQEAAKAARAVQATQAEVPKAPHELDKDKGKGRSD